MMLAAIRITRRPLSTRPALAYADVAQAYKRISPFVRQTPLDYSFPFSDAYQCEVFLKKEHISRTGSYKERGALNKLLQLNEQERKNGVVCASAGNHAQAVSYHGTRLGIDAVIVMPEGTPFVKVKATRGYGAKVVLHGAGFHEAYEKALEIAEAESRTFVHAFNDRDVVAGQGTVAMEIMQQNPYLDAIIVPIGGGGLIAGMALAIKHINPRIKLFGVETSQMPGMKVSVDSSQVVKVPRKLTIADGIAIETIGQVPFDVIHELVDDIVVVTEEEIAASIMMLIEKEKTVVEGSGATSLAAVAFNKVTVKGMQIACVLTGSNIDMSLLSRVIEKGLVTDGRIARLSLTIADSPGQLSGVIALMAKSRANIRDIEHERAFLLSSVQQTKPIITLETRGPDHINEIMQLLKEHGYHDVALTTPHF